MHASSKFIADRASLAARVHESLPAAVRRAVRDNWEKCLIGSDFHQAFVLNASIHHASPAAVQRGMRDFGKSLVACAKTQILDQMTTADLDHVAPQILSKASVAFFDKVLEMRLKTIDAKRLINALARAERLGYEPSDVQDDDQAPIAPPVLRSQQLTQPAPVPVAPSSSADAAAAAAAAAATASSPAANLHCRICFRRFPGELAYHHHTKMKVCTRLPSTPGGFKYNCQHCGQGFTTPMGLSYHHTNHICGYYDNLAPNSKVSDPAAPPSRTALSAPSIPSRSKPAAPYPFPSTGLPSQAASPVPALFSGASRRGTPASTDDSPSDPYAHLSPEQLAALQAELAEAEVKFGDRMRQANMIPDVGERKNKLEGLSNSFGTKQSLIRKKYGVRLRVRRTKTEIEQERSRMQYRTSAELQADMTGTLTQRAGPGRPVASSSSSASRSRAMAPSTTTGSSWSPWPPSQAAPTTLASAVPVPAPSKTNDSDDVRMHGGKRRFSGAGDLPAAKRVAYSDMGGLGGAMAEAETVDPTAARNKAPPMGVGTKDEPLSLDGSSSEEGSGSDSDGSDADEDIPAVLPASVMQTLQRSSPVAASSKPGSSPAMAASPSEVGGSYGV